MSINIETVRAGGSTTDLFRFGTGERPLVIIPGLSVQSVTGSAEAVAEEYAVMKNDFTVFVFDRKRDLKERYSVAEMADDTAEAIGALGLRDVCVFGASQGGMIALYLAARYPDLVKKAAVASTPAFVTERGFDAVRGWIDAAKKQDGAALYLAFGEAIYPREVFEKYEGALTLLGDGVTEDEFRRFITLAEAAKDFDVRPIADGIRCPLMVAASRDDGVFGDGIVDGFDKVFKGRRGYSSLVYEGYGHAMYDTAPDFRDKLYSFFTDE